MAISETKMQMVIANYFKDECDVNTSIRQAFEKGFRIGVNKGVSMNRPQGEWTHRDSYWHTAICSNCNKLTMFEEWDEEIIEYDFCPNCGCRMKRSRR